jgi:hypothetical protein
MKLNYRFSMILLSFTACLAVSSCQKDKTPENATDTAAMESISAEENFLETSFNAVFDDATGIDDATAGEDLGIYGSTGAGVYGREMNSEARTTARCFTVTVFPKEKGVFPKTVTLDFGAGCEAGGHTRKGKIIFTYTGRLNVPGKQVVTTFENYSIDSFSIEGKHTLTNSATAGANQKSFSVKIENGKITNVNNGKWWTRNSDRQFVQTEGNGTDFFPIDDVFSITGNASGANANGKTWVSEITSPLIKKFTCKWLVKGVLSISVNSTVGSLDFGNGDCDNKANLTVNGRSKTITLR